jgi:hypothetical protein
MVALCECPPPDHTQERDDDQRQRNHDPMHGVLLSTSTVLITVVMTVDEGVTLYVVSS